MMTDMELVKNAYPKAVAISSTVQGITKYRIEDMGNLMEDSRMLCSWMPSEEAAWVMAARQTRRE